MVLELHGAPAHGATIGPAEAFRLDGGRLTGPEDREFLRYEDGYWTHEGRRFTSVVCHGPVICQFERSIEGPFQTLTLTGGVLWADSFSLARYDARDRRWQLLYSGDSFTGVELREPPPDRPPR